MRIVVTVSIKRPPAETLPGFPALPQVSQEREFDSLEAALAWVADTAQRRRRPTCRCAPRRRRPAWNTRSGRGMGRREWLRGAYGHNCRGPDLDAAAARLWAEEGLVSLDGLSGWNPGRRERVPGLLITMEPYVAESSGGVLEVWVALPLRDLRGLD